MLVYPKDMENMMNDNTKKAEQIAKDKVAEIAKANEAESKANEEAKAESTAAAELKNKGEVKTEGKESILAKAEKKAEEDARVLSTSDDSLSEDDKKRKAELVKEKEAKETPEDKIKRTQEATQKRIDEVIGELKASKAEREQDKEKIASLETSLAELTKPKEEETKASKVSNLFEQRTAKYLEEDKSKSRENRREMPKEDLEEWLLEDYVSATEWLTDRTIRRNQDKKDIVKSFDDVPKQLAQEFVDKQTESVKKLLAKYPDVAKKDSEDYIIVQEIVNSDTKKYVESVDGPEQVMAELDRRKGRSNKTLTLTEDELNQRIKEAAVVEAQRIANLDEGLTSSGGKKVETKEKKSEFRLKQEEIARKAGISTEDLKSAIDRREKIGVIASTAEDFNSE